MGGAACALAQDEMDYDHDHVTRLSNILVDGLTSQLPNVVRNGGTSLYPGCVNLSFHCVEGESLLMALKDVAHSSIRFGIGRFTSQEEVEYTIQRTVKEVSRLRELTSKLLSGLSIKYCSQCARKALTLKRASIPF